jgi:creatinine amidohydrolase
MSSELLEASRVPLNLKRVDELTFADLERLDRDRTVCVCAVSALEVHGPHLPIGADLHQASWMADETGRRFAERHPDWTVLRYPPLPLGTDELPLPGSVNTPAQTLYRAVYAFGAQLVRAGFRYVMLTNAHGGPRHAAALESVARRLSKKHGVAVITPSIRALHRLVSGDCVDEIEDFLGRKLSDDERHGIVSGEHAGTWETAWYLARRPELVDPCWKELADEQPPRFTPLARVAGWLEARAQKHGAEGTKGSGRMPLHDVLGSLAGSIGWMLNTRNGYGRSGSRVSYKGWPQIASAELGEAYCELPVRMCLDDLEAVVEGRVAASEVRSIASDPLLIQPGVLRAIGIAALAIVGLAIWIAL